MIEGEKIHVHVQLPAMKPVLTSQQKQLSMVVSSLHENRLHVTSRRGDDVIGHVGDVIGQVVAVKAESLEPVCVLNFPVPAAEIGDEVSVQEEMIERVLRRKKKSSEDEEEEDGSRVELRLTDIAELIHDDWQELSTELQLSQADIDNILSQYSYPSEQVATTNTTQNDQHS